MPTQTELPFVSLDFPGRVTLMSGEIAAKLGCSPLHIANLVDSGELVAIDLASPNTSRRYMRIVAESYRHWITKQLTGPAPAKAEFLAKLPPEIRKCLVIDLLKSLSLELRLEIGAEFAANAAA